MIYTLECTHQYLNNMTDNKAFHWLDVEGFERELAMREGRRTKIDDALRANFEKMRQIESEGAKAFAKLFEGMPVHNGKAYTWNIVK